MKIINIKELVEKYRINKSLLRRNIYIIFIVGTSQIRDICIKDIIDNNKIYSYVRKEQIITILDDDLTIEIEFNIVNDCCNMVARHADIIIYVYNAFICNIMTEIIPSLNAGGIFLTIPLHPYNDFLYNMDYKSLLELRFNIESELNKYKLGLRSGNEIN
ncbi:MAG: hypothetical protein PHN69_05005 [Candidatus Pacebacteria bacterium]|nr:hypothetical protein [Candidatus Paceibacterota bacterium]